VRAVPPGAGIDERQRRSCLGPLSSTNGERTGAGQTDHRDFMSPSELRLLSEWLDIGAQYYNDPFVAPAN
jgi:hypothetical protein